MKKILLYFILSLFFFFLGSGIGFFMAQKKINIKKNDIYNQCFNDARETLSKVYKMPAKKDVNFIETNFYGKIAKLDVVNNNIVIDPAALSNGRDNISSLVLVLDNDTELKKVIKKTDEEYKKELEEFNQKHLKNKDLKYPLQFTRISVNFNDFSVGQKITVFSKEDIRNKEEVGVSRIIINYQ